MSCIDPIAEYAQSAVHPDPLDALVPRVLFLGAAPGHFVCGHEFGMTLSTTTN